MTINNITQKMKANPSYLKKGDTWLANYFNCSPRTARNIKKSLASTKKRYTSNLASSYN